MVEVVGILGMVLEQSKIWRNAPTDDDDLLKPLASPFFVHFALFLQNKQKLAYYCLIDQLDRRPSILHFIYGYIYISSSHYISGIR